MVEQPGGSYRPSLAELGVSSGSAPRGPLNAITDVPGVLVGHATVRTETLNTGVTAIVPEQLSSTRRALPAALAVGNGYGKLVGATQLRELGAIETPILLTSTLSVFRVADALLGYMLEQPGYESVTTLNPMVGETNDGALSDIRQRAVGDAHVHEALENAASGKISEGSVGAGTGTVTMGYKGGIGTASRVVAFGSHEYAVGVLVQSNYSGTLQIDGVPMPASELLRGEEIGGVGNSCMIVIATDAPLDSRQLGRLANRAVIAMRATGSDFHQGSGDYAIAFSVGDDRAPHEDDLSLGFLAVMEATEEALVNSVLRAETTEGFRGKIAHAVPTHIVRQRLVAAGRISQ